MAIGIGLHCLYCDHGPCNGDCRSDDQNSDEKKVKEIRKIFEWLQKRDYLTDDVDVILKEYLKKNN